MHNNRWKNRKTRPASRILPQHFDAPSTTTPKVVAARMPTTAAVVVAAAKITATAAEHKTGSQKKVAIQVEKGPETVLLFVIQTALLFATGIATVAVREGAAVKIADLQIVTGTDTGVTRASKIAAADIEIRIEAETA